MQPTTSIPAPTPIGRTDRPQPTPLSQLVAKILNVPAPQPAPAVPEPQANAAKAEPPSRTDGRHMRLGSFVDIRV